MWQHVLQFITRNHLFRGRRLWRFTAMSSLEPRGVQTRSRIAKWKLRRSPSKTAGGWFFFFFFCLNMSKPCILIIFLKILFLKRWFYLSPRNEWIILLFTKAHCEDLSRECNQIRAKRRRRMPACKLFFKKIHMASPDMFSYRTWGGDVQIPKCQERNFSNSQL